VVEDFAITAFSFSKEFEAAIEAKSRAEQERMKAERDLERIRVEAEQQLTRARAETEALALQREQITPELLQWKALERWDGKLPEVVAGGGSALQIPLSLPQTRSR
jgi:prohibitin 2